VVTAERLRAEIERLKALRGAASASVPADRLEFAHSLGIVPDPWQAELLGSEALRILLNCSRQSGKSTMASILALHKALAAPGSLILILAPAERQAKELFSKVAAFYRTLGHIIPMDSYRKLGMNLASGSRIEALPGSEKTIRGFSGVDLLIVDEAARVADELYYTVRPMLAVSGGRLMMLSTPFGKRGVFYEEWTGGEGWERYTATAEECPRIPPAFLEAERKTLGPWWFAQEYECRFMDTVDQVFQTEVIDKAITDEVAPLFGGAA
jgi:Terminase large subunit, T4likevirus-type, N-terminal